MAARRAHGCRGWRQDLRRLRPVQLDQSKTEAWQKELDREHDAQAEATRRAQAQQTPEGRWSLLLEGKAERDINELVRVHLEKQPIPDLPERRAFARAVAATGLPVLWRRGQKRDPMTQVGGAKLKARARLIDVAASGDDSVK
jgi:hypothetical protein